jgi:hypothetical protein
MKNILILMSFLFLGFLNQAKAQLLVLVGTKFELIGTRGDPYLENPYTVVTGDPYLVNDWTSGFVILDNNQKASATLKYDINSNIVLFQGKNGETWQLKDNFKGFTLANTNNVLSNLDPLIFDNGFPNKGKQTPATFYQLIADGKVKLLKYYKKNIDEHREYPSAITTKTFKAAHAYFVFSNNQLTEIKPNKKSLLKLFNEHSAEIEVYLKDNNINLKSDADLKKLFTWYNSLS